MKSLLCSALVVYASSVRINTEGRRFLTLNNHGLEDNCEEMQPADEEASESPNVLNFYDDIYEDVSAISGKHRTIVIPSMEVDEEEEAESESEPESEPETTNQPPVYNLESTGGFTTVTYNQNSGTQLIRLPPSFSDFESDPVTESVDLQSADSFASYNPATRTVALLVDQNICPGQYKFTATLRDAFGQTEYPVDVIINDIGQDCIMPEDEESDVEEGSTENSENQIP